MDRETFDKLVEQFKILHESLTELLDEIQNHRDLTVVNLK